MPPTPDSILLELKITGELAGDYVANVMHLEAPIAAFTLVGEEPPVSIEYLGLQTALQDLNDGTGGFLGLYLACLPVDYTCRSMQLRGVGFSIETTEQQLHSLTAIIAGGDLDATAGTRTGEISSQNLSPGLVWITDSPKRQGKMFLPGLSESDVTGGVIADALEMAIAAFGTLCTSGTLEMNSEAGVHAAVYQRPNGAEWNGTWRPSFASKLGMMVYQQGRRRVPW